MVKIIKLRDQTFPNQRVAKLKLGRNQAKQLPAADVTLHCGITGRTFKAHKIVLAAISERLRDYLVQHEREGDACCCFSASVPNKCKQTPSDEGVHLIIDHMDWEVLRIIIDFAYSGEARVAASIVDRVCEAAHRLQIKYLRDSFVKMGRK